MYTTYCKKCGCKLIGDDKSHPLYCKACYELTQLEQDRKRKQMKRKYREELGTRNFGPNMKRREDKTPNFRAERRAVRKELRELGLIK